MELDDVPTIILENILKFIPSHYLLVAQCVSKRWSSAVGIYYIVLFCLSLFYFFKFFSDPHLNLLR